MSNVIVEGFATYGVGDNDGASDPVREAMLAGAWASIDAGAQGIGTLPWDANNLDLYLVWRMGVSGSGGFNGARRVLPSAEDAYIFSFYFAVSELPTNDQAQLLNVTNTNGDILATLGLLSTGALAIYDERFETTLAVTSGPVIAAETPAHIELSLDCVNGEAELRVDGEQVIDTDSLTFTLDEQIAQFGALGDGPSSDDQHSTYMSHLIVRDTSGTVNNGITGDRKVATLLPNADVEGEQGWAARPLQRFGAGILDLPTAAVFNTDATNDTDIGDQEFTIEGQWRFRSLPSGATRATLFSKWFEGDNERCYELYLGGPDFENGLLTFRTSTDGQAGTVEHKLQWPWEPVLGQWYHIAVVRSSGELILFIDGVQQGPAVPDADTYFASTIAHAAIGSAGAGIGSSLDDDTAFDGWQDEFRLTVGTARYTSGFTPPTEGFDRDAEDPDWSSVKWLSSWDGGSLADDGPLGLELTGRSNAAVIFPNDVAAAYETLNKATPDDDSFITAELIAAQGIFTLTDTPTNGETVTIDGDEETVYEFVDTLGDPYDVLIGDDAAESLENLEAAINGGAGEGSVYGTGTDANVDVSSEIVVTGQLRATALTPGSGGNNIDTSDTCADGSWGASSLEGGEDIPDPSQFSFERMPPNTTIVDSVTLVTRQWRNEAGTAQTRVSFIGGEDGESQGNENALSNSPSLKFDTFEDDPDEGSLTPASILHGKLKIDRTS